MTIFLLQFTIAIAHINIGNVNKEIGFTIKSAIWCFRKVYYITEFQFWGVFLDCELWYYYNIMIKGYLIGVT